MALLRSWVFGMQTVRHDLSAGTAQAGVPVPPMANRDRTGRSACATKDKQGPHRQECLCTKDEQGNQSPVAVGEVLRR
jgi:hypothetical protein